MKLKTTRSPSFWLTAALLTAGGCATQSAVKRIDNGPPVALDSGAQCKTNDERGKESDNPNGARPLPDTQLCEKIKQSLSAALTQAGFPTATPDATGSALKAKLWVVQDAKMTGEPSVLTKGDRRGLVHLNILVSLERNGEELEKFQEDAEFDQAQDLDKSLNETAQQIARAMVESPRVQQASNRKL